MVINSGGSKRVKQKAKTVPAKTTAPAAVSTSDPYLTQLSKLYKPLTPAEIEAMVNRQVTDATKPQLAFYEQQRQDALSQFAAKAAANKDLYAALGDMLKGIGPTIAGIYGDAAKAQDAFGSGYSADLTAKLGDQANQSADLLKNVAGAPDAQVAQANKTLGPQSGDVLKFLGGEVPANEMSADGAAWGAAAAMAPSWAAGYANMNLSSLQSGLDSQLKDIAANMKQVLDSQPALRDQIRQAITSQDQSNRDWGMKVMDTLYQHSQDAIQNARADRAEAVQEAYLNNTLRTSQASVTGVDPVTGLPTATTTYHQTQADAAAARRAAAARQAAAKAAAAKVGARNKAVHAREGAFQQAQQQIFTDAQGLRQKVKPVDWVLAHPGHKLSEAPAYEPTVDYVTAKKNLFNQYKYLLRYATRAGQPALKRRLNQIIDEALAAIGLHPTVAPKKPRGPYTVKPKKPYTIVAPPVVVP